MVLFRGKTIGWPHFGRATLWIALCLFGAAGGARAEYAEWCGPDDILRDTAIQISTVSKNAYWPTWLKDVGRSDKRRGGNELCILPQQLEHGARPVIYLSGPAPWENTLKSALLCRTLVHVVLGPESRDNRLIANHLIFGRFLYNHLEGGADLNSISEECSGAVASPALLARSHVCPPFCSICALVRDFQGAAASAGSASMLKNQIERDLALILRSVDYQAKLHAYLHKSAAYLGTQDNNTVPELFSAGRTASVDKASHTEILLIHDNGGRLPVGTVVLSRYSMCHTCEPAIVRAAEGVVWFISRCIYDQSYVAGKNKAPVKKAVVYSDGKAVSVDDLWTVMGSSTACNFLNPSDTTVFGGKSWLAE